MFEARRPEVDDLDGTLRRMLEQNVLRLEIAMNDSMMSKQRERAEDLRGESTDEGRRESSKAVGLDEFVEIDAEKFGDDAEMLSKRERVDHPNDEVLLFRILLTFSSVLITRARRRKTDPFDEILENLNFDQSLMMKSLLVPNDLDRDHLTCTVISTLQHLSKRSFPQNVNDLVTIANVVVRDEQVVASIVVVSEVVCSIVFAGGKLRNILTGEIDLLVTCDFDFLVLGERSRIQS